MQFFGARPAAVKAALSGAADSKSSSHSSPGSGSAAAVAGNVVDHPADRQKAIRADPIPDLMMKEGEIPPWTSLVDTLRSPWMLI
jgi:hypothetical protein